MMRRFVPAVARSAVQARTLSIHEYQAKQLLREAGCCVEEGYAVDKVEDVKAICDKISTDLKVVKSQILAGGRGRGTFDTGFEGGVHVCKGTAEAVKVAGEMLGHKLITKQTGADGVEVRKLYISEAVPIVKEFYLAMMLDRGFGGPVIIGSAEGGMAIEDVAAKNPDAIKKLPVKVKDGLSIADATKFAKELGFDAKAAPVAAEQIVNLYNLMRSSDATQIEINPLVLLKDGRVMLVDAKLSFDDNAEYRQPKIFAMRDSTETDIREVEAAKEDLNYIGLDGNIGCLVNGAGLAMATMDNISLFGGRPANFLDVGGGATKEKVAFSLRLITSDPNVKGILVNVFGGIVDCGMIAEGVIAAVKEVGLNIPMVVRLDGTNADAGKAILKESGMNLIPADDLNDASQKICEAVGVSK
ncbi:Succinyl-CoA ligase subunit beta [Diplonema papillatum]|nr:Succinyl-CoA ligase subunit beta [Diplonema papillatum]